MAIDRQDKKRRGVGFVAFIAVIAVIAGVGTAALLVNIMERQREAEDPYFTVVELDDNTVDPAIWGKNFPLQYDLYKRTVDMVRTRYGGSEALPQVPDYIDPRSVVAQSRIEEDPRLKRMWAGYAFSVDFREERGHAYMLVDQEHTLRQKFSQQPGTCLHCHASVYVPYKELGNGDLIKGFEMMNPMTYPAARQHVEHPVACIDCHDPDNMQLRITRPGFLEGIATYKATQGIENYNVNTDASHQEMRTYVCAQCHVEYYFKGKKEKRLTYLWHKGLKGDEILSYYEEVGFTDWTHAESGAPVLKAQHPEFEMWSQGIHARSGVSCSDCHMPYKRVGAQKISDHHVRSPLLNINNACQTCHQQTEDELKTRAENIQRHTLDMRGTALDALIDLIDDIKAGKDKASPEQIEQAQLFQKRAQFLLDFVEAENSMGFHASQEAARLLLQSVDYSRKGQNALR